MKVSMKTEKYDDNVFLFETLLEQLHAFLKGSVRPPRLSDTNLVQ